MTDDRLQPYTEEPRLTPWVGRIMAANAVVLLLLQTVFTAPAFVDALQFVPGRAAGRPWAVLSYMFVHGGLLHLAGNMLRTVRVRASGRTPDGRPGLPLSTTSTAVSGAAALALGLSSFMPVDPFVGASGAVLGVALAFAFAWPDAELVVFRRSRSGSPRVRWCYCSPWSTCIAAFWVNDGIAHVAHLGGMAAGYIFFRIQALASSRRNDKEAQAARPPAGHGADSGAPGKPGRRGTSRDGPAGSREEQLSADELDRVLDKISAFGTRQPDARRSGDSSTRPPNESESDLH